MDQPQVVHVSRKFRVLRLDSDPKRVFEMVAHPGAAVILPLLKPEEPTGGPRVVLVENQRRAVGRRLLELPAGTLDPGESPAGCARRELVEETGYEAAEVRPLVTFYSTPGFCNEVMHLFVATGLRAGVARPEADEDLRVRVLALDDLLARIGRGEIVDGKTIAGVLYYARFAGAVAGAGPRPDGS